ncbi:hypothetical protein VTO42DRAFT_7194 [Malbranchea cinnamomea]
MLMLMLMPVVPRTALPVSARFARVLHGQTPRRIPRHSRTYVVHTSVQHQDHNLQRDGGRAEVLEERLPFFPLNRFTPRTSTVPTPLSISQGVQQCHSTESTCSLVKCTRGIETCLCVSDGELSQFARAVLCTRLTSMPAVAEGAAAPCCPHY